MNTLYVCMNIKWEMFSWHLIWAHGINPPDIRQMADVGFFTLTISDIRMMSVIRGISARYSSSGWIAIYRISIISRIYSKLSIVRRMSTICHISASQGIPIIHQINAVWRMSGGNPPCYIWRMESIGFPTLSFCIPTAHSQGNLIFLETWIPAKVELKKLSPIDLRVYWFHGSFPFF